MKVLMQGRTNLFTLPGGDTIQLTKTKSELEKLGVEVDISLKFDPDLSAYDVVHLSNVTRIQETYLQMKNAKKQNKPVVLSTIFWPMDDFEKRGQKGIRKIVGSVFSINEEEKIKALVRYIKDKDSRNKAIESLWKVGYKNMQKYVISKANYFLPNSEMEMEVFSRYFNLIPQNYLVVPNAIDTNIAQNAMQSPSNPKFARYKDAVICVGRIETRKNQVALARALDGSNYKVIFVGRPSNNQPKYFEELKKYIDKNKNFIHIDNIKNSELYELYKVCRVSALPSWLDTPGLVSLEAAAMGCNLAVSTKGSTKEYFKNYAFYCEPDNISSIRKAVDLAYNSKYNGEFRNLIFRKYSWKNAANMTLEGYKKVLCQKN